MATTNGELLGSLWGVADQLRANSELTSAEYKSPVLGLVFLRFVDHKFSAVKELVTVKPLVRVVLRFRHVCWLQPGGQRHRVAQAGGHAPRCRSSQSVLLLVGDLLRFK